MYNFLSNISEDIWKYSIWDGNILFQTKSGYLVIDGSILKIENFAFEESFICYEDTKQNCHFIDLSKNKRVKIKGSWIILSTFDGTNRLCYDYKKKIKVYWINLYSGEKYWELQSSLIGKTSYVTKNTIIIIKDKILLSLVKNNNQLLWETDISQIGTYQKNNQTFEGEVKKILGVYNDQTLLVVLAGESY